MTASVELANLFRPLTASNELSQSEKTLPPLSHALDADNYGATPTSEAVEGLAYYFSGHDYLEVTGLDISPRAFPKLTLGAWVKVK